MSSEICRKSVKNTQNYKKLKKMKLKREILKLHRRKTPNTKKASQNKN